MTSGAARAAAQTGRRPPGQGLIGVSPGELRTGTSDPALAEGGVVHRHGGIVPEIHGWNVKRPVAKITIKRIG